MHGLQRCFTNSSWFKILCNGLNIADNEAQWILHFTDNKELGRSTISDAVCVGSPVIIKLFTKKVNKQVYEKIGIFN